MILPTFSFPETFSFLTSSLIATPVEHLSHLHFVTASSNVLGKSLKHYECMLQAETDALLPWFCVGADLVKHVSVKPRKPLWKAAKREPKSQRQNSHRKMLIMMTRKYVCVYGSSLTQKHIISIMIMTIIPSYQHILPASPLVWIPWLGCFEGLSPNMFVAI